MWTESDTGQADSARLALFPLRTVLLPAGRLSLQVFEARYLDLVRDCLRNDRSFGITWIRDGEEVMRPGSMAPVLARVGCEAHIVDWDSLPNGLLGVTVEGGRRFTLQDSRQTEHGLHWGEVSWRDGGRPYHSESAMEGLRKLLSDLMEHPHVKRLGLAAADDPALCVYQLAQLLPIDDGARYTLLEEDDPAMRLDALLGLLEQIGN